MAAPSTSTPPPDRSPELSPAPSNHHLSVMTAPSTSSSPPASKNFQLVLSDDSESGYFRFKPVSPSKDKKLSMECKVMLKKLPPTIATVFKIQEYESLDIQSSSRGKTVRGGKGGRGGNGRRGGAGRRGGSRRVETGRNPGTKN